MSDLIDRQATIDAIDGEAELIRRALDNMDVIGGERSKFAWGLGLLELCIYDLNDLPSAQPEIVRCKDCIYWDFPGYCVDFMTQDENGFCSWAERRTDEQTDRC